MPPVLRRSLTLLQIACLIALATAGWFILDHWAYVGATAFGILLASLYVELFYERKVSN